MSKTGTFYVNYTLFELFGEYCDLHSREFHKPQL